MKHYALVAGLVVALFGCATEPQKATNWQTEKAGEYIETNAADPGIKQAGKDVKENSVVLRKAVFGDPKPENQKPYSPKNSDDARKDAATPWWQYALGGTGLMGLLATGFRMAARYVPWLAGPWGTIATTVIEGLVKGRAEAEKAPNVEEAIKAILANLASTQEAAGVQQMTKKIAADVEKDWGIIHNVKAD
jgi:hypothetical protein